MIVQGKFACWGCALLGVIGLRCASSDDAPSGGEEAGNASMAGSGGSSANGGSLGGTTGASGAQGTGGTSSGTGGSNSAGAGQGGGAGNLSRDAGAAGSSGGGSGGSAPTDAGAVGPNPCIEAGNCMLGSWIEVTPSGVDLTNALGCGNFGTQSMQVDPVHPSDFYTLFMCQGIWKSTDYGQTWKGPINTGAQGAMVGDCAGGITMPPKSTATNTTVYEACIRGNGIGFWRSTNGGVDWIRYNVAPGAQRQDFYPPVVDPYDINHLLMAGHEMNVLVESVDGGQTWTAVTTDPGMAENGGTAGIFFIDTGSAATTKKTFLWLAQQSDVFGSWRTSDSGATWKRVDKNEHLHGNSQIFQPDTSGVVFMAGVYSTLGWGVLRSTDYGVTWAHVGKTGSENVAFGTNKFVYSMSSGASGLGSTVDPNFEAAPLPGTGTWMSPGTPAAMKQGAAQAAISNDGKHNVIVTANWGAGLWRYVEP
jgi:hypothetical protein